MHITVSCSAVQQRNSRQASVCNKQCVRQACEGVCVLVGHLPAVQAYIHIYVYK